jgi:lycopene cyclase domain-containing protein
MSYLVFLLIFVMPPLIALSALMLRPPGPSRIPRRGWIALVCFTALAVAVTAPWDSYLIAHDVWRHGDVLGRLLRVPAEEYAFMVGQCLGAGLLLFLLWHRFQPGVAMISRWPGAAAWGAVSLAAWTVHGDPQWSRWFYFTAIVGWFGPLIAVQWAVGGDRLVAWWRLRLVGVALPTAYLWIADRIAIGAGAWWINPDQTLPVRPFGLPVEEALFFLVTNLVLVNGLVLALDEQMWTRAQQWARVRHPPSGRPPGRRGSSPPRSTGSSS